MSLFFSGSFSLFFRINTNFFFFEKHSHERQYFRELLLPVIYPKYTAEQRCYALSTVLKKTISWVKCLGGVGSEYCFPVTALVVDNSTGTDKA
jgi:hypothetical protein